MKHPPILSRALRAIGVVGIAVALAACASAPTAAVTANGAAANGAAANGARTGVSARAGQGAQGVTGDVMSVNGNSFDVQVPGQSGPYTVVNLSSSTQILKQATTTMSVVSTGASISATGTESNGVLTATQVRVLGQAGQVGDRPGGPQANGTPRAGGPQANGTPRTGAFAQRPGTNGQGNGGTSVFGTLESVSTDGLTIKAANGTTTQVHLAPNAQITMEEAATTADIKPGVRVLVVGDEQNGTVTATRVQIEPAAQQ